MIPATDGKRFKLRDTRHNWAMQLVDFTCICIGVALIVWIYPPATPSAALHNSVAAVAGVLFCLAGASQQLYQTQWLRRAALDEVRTVCICWACVVAPLMLLGFATKVLAHFSRVATLSWILMAPLLIVLCRMLARGSSRARRTAPRRVAIAGWSVFGEHICSVIQSAPTLGLTVVGAFDDRTVLREGAEPVALPNAGSFEQLIAAARDGLVDVIYIALPLRAESRAIELIRRLQDTTASVYIAFDFASLAGKGYRHLAYVGQTPVIPMLVGATRSVKTQALTLVRAMRRKTPSMGTAAALSEATSHASLNAKRASAIDQRQATGPLV